MNSGRSLHTTAVDLHAQVTGLIRDCALVPSSSQNEAREIIRSLKQVLKTAKDKLEFSRDIEITEKKLAFKQIEQTMDDQITRIKQWRATHSGINAMATAQEDVRRVCSNFNKEATYLESRINKIGRPALKLARTISDTTDYSLTDVEDTDDFSGFTTNDCSTEIEDLTKIGTTSEAFSDSEQFSELASDEEYAYVTASSEDEEARQIVASENILEKVLKNEEPTIEEVTNIFDKILLKIPNKQNQKSASIFNSQAITNFERKSIKNLDGNLKLKKEDWLENFKNKKSTPKHTKPNHTRITLEITVENIPNKLSFGISDPYFQFIFQGAVLYQSEVKRDQLSCSWLLATFEVPNDCFCGRVRLRVGDSESDEDDDLLVEVEMDFPFKKSVYVSDCRSHSESLRVMIDKFDVSVVDEEANMCRY